MNVDTDMQRARRHGVNQYSKKNTDAKLLIPRCERRESDIKHASQAGVIKMNIDTDTQRTCRDDVNQYSKNNADAKLLIPR
mmetsp:Transcript_67684/g.209260  ORF Transcript_67684/g.209260 Transcript_67684/m.209260 type:complete len:81 (-) Transcript_67684:212-454(-)